MSNAKRPADGPVVHAAGGIPWRVRGGRLEVALVHRPRYRDWSWPKGKLEPGESLPGAACREVAEETGIPVVLGAPLPTLRYRTPDGDRKEVHYWAARLASDDDAAALGARALVRQAPVTEIDDVVWVSAPTAADLLTRATDRKPLATLVGLHDAGRLATRAVAVLRHGRAKQRSAWSDGEATRPLTKQGQAQARALVEVLAGFGIGEIWTSPWRRCLDTVLPYAKATGLGPCELDALTEDAVRADPGPAVATVADLLAQPRDAVVCTHRPALAAVLSAVADATRRWTTGTVPDDDPWLRTGEVLVAHVAGAGAAARVVAVEAHRPAHPE